MSWNFAKFKLSNKFNKEKYDVGILQEKAVLPLLKVFFNDDSIVNLPEGHTFDFKGNNKYIELKSRSCKQQTYTDTAIGVSKIRQAYKDVSTTQYYFVFKFSDGMYYWKYDSSVKLRTAMIYNIPHLFIPNSVLLPMVEEKSVRFAKENSTHYI